MVLAPPLEKLAHLPHTVLVPGVGGAPLNPSATSHLPMQSHADPQPEVMGNQLQLLQPASDVVGDIRQQFQRIFGIPGVGSGGGPDTSMGVTAGSNWKTNGVRRSGVLE